MMRADMPTISIGSYFIGAAFGLGWILIESGHTFGRKDYDPNEIAKDGPFTAPRKWLHVQKVLIGLAVGAIVYNVLLAVMPYPWPWWHVFLVGPGIVVAVAVKERISPSDPDSHSIGEHITDWITDGACYSGSAVLYYVRNEEWWVALVVAALLFTAYRACRNGARP